MNAQDLAILSEYKNVDTSSSLINGPGATEDSSQGPEGSLTSLELVCTKKDPCNIKSCKYETPCLRAQTQKSKIITVKEVKSYTTNSEKEVRSSTANSAKEVRSSTALSEKEVSSTANSEKEVRSSTTFSEKEFRSSMTFSEKEEFRSSTTLSEKEFTKASSSDPLDILENGLKSSGNSQTKNSVYSVKSEKKSKTEEKNKITNYFSPKTKKKFS